MVLPALLPAAETRAGQVRGRGHRGRAGGDRPGARVTAFLRPAQQALALSPPHLGLCPRHHGRFLSPTLSLVSVKIRIVLLFPRSGGDPSAEPRDFYQHRVFETRIDRLGSTSRIALSQGDCDRLWL